MNTRRGPQVEELSIKALRSFSGVGAVEVGAASTALIVIDMQNDFVHHDGFTVRRLLERGLPEAAAQYERQMRTIIPNLRRMIDRAHQRGQVVIFVNYVSYPGREAGGQKNNQWIPPGSEGAEIISELGAQPDDLVLSKCCSGAFPGTNLDFHLRRRGITSLLVGGVVTDGCVEQAIRQAHDLGYACVLLSDGSGALTDEIHENALERLEHRRAHVRTTDVVLSTRVIEATDVALVGGKVAS